MQVPYSQKMSRGRFETWTEKPSFSFHQATQVHGTDIVSPETLPCEADGIFISWEDFDQPLAIKTADCLPIVIEGEKGIVFVHAGWRGLAHGILERPEVSMIKPTQVLIGPSIQACCFEVSEDFQGNFPDSPYFQKIGERYLFNLQEEAKRRLKIHFPEIRIQDDSLCTCCNHSFHSHRRNKTTERNWNLYLKG